MLDKIVVYALLAALLASGIWGIAHGESRYADGVAAERSHWEGEIRAANARIADLEKRDDHEAAEIKRRAAVAELEAMPLAAVPADVVKAASYPADVRDALNRINVR